MTFCVTTITYQDRPTLPKVIKSLLETTIFPSDATWYFVLQNCSQEFCDNIVQLCSGKIETVLIRFSKNIGLSKSLAFVIEQTKYYDFMMMIEDDWIALEDTHIPNKGWLLTTLKFLNEHKDVSTIFLRAYSSEAEKFQYGWTRSINYICHKHKDNFNYQEKIKNSERIKFTEDITFTHIPHMLLTWNPTIHRNVDFHKYACPIPVFDKDTKTSGDNSNWSRAEGFAMERTRDLKSMWLNEGVFGHYEDFMNLDNFKAKWGY